MNEFTVRANDLVDSRKSERRKFIRDHHPDRGGDPEAFIAGLRQRSAAQPGVGEPRVVFRRRPRRTRRLRLTATSLIHRFIRRPKRNYG